MKVDAIRRSFYSAKNNLRNLSEKRQKNVYSQSEMLNMPRTQVWSEIKAAAESFTQRFAK